MTDIETILRRYGNDLDDRCPPVSPAELERHAESIGTVDGPTFGAGVSDNGAGVSDSDAAGHRVRPEAAPEYPSVRSVRRWPIAVIGAAAAAVLIIVVLLSQGDGADDGTIVTDDPELPIDDGPVEDDQIPGEDNTTSPAATPVIWSRIDGVAPRELISDGRSFFALADRGAQTELLTSADGTTWRSVGTVPFDHLDAARSGQVLSSKVEQSWTEGRFEALITVYTVRADGTITESSVVPTIPQRHELFVENLGVSATFLDPDGLVITGSYSLSHEAVVAAALGLSEEPSGPDRGEQLASLLAAAGVDSSYGSLSDTEVSVGGVVANLSDFGLTGQELEVPLGVNLVSSDAGDWEEVAVPPSSWFEGELTTVEGAVVDRIYGDSGRSITLSMSEDGASWTEVMDLASARPVSCQRLVPGRDRALCLDADAAWLIGAAGASQLVTEGTEFANIDPDSVEDSEGWTMTIGDGGVAYLTGFTEGVPEEPGRATAIVVSTDFETWTRFSLTDEMIGPEGEPRARRIAMGADGVVVWGSDTAWFGEMQSP